jgi:hypothetical protein
MPRGDGNVMRALYYGDNLEVLRSGAIHQKSGEIRDDKFILAGGQRSGC